MNMTQNGAMRYSNLRGKVNYFPSAREPSATPIPSGAEAANATGFQTVPARVQGRKMRARARSFQDHFSQARLFWNSLAPWERAHVVSAFSFELNNVESAVVRANAVHNMLCKVDMALARAVAARIGVTIDVARAAAPVPKPAGAGEGTESELRGPEYCEGSGGGAVGRLPRSAALSMDRPQGPGAAGLAGRKVAVVAAPGACGEQWAALRARASALGLQLLTVTPTAAPVALADGTVLPGGAATVPASTANPAAFTSVFVLRGAEAGAHGRRPAPAQGAAPPQWDRGGWRNVIALVTAALEHGKPVCDGTEGAAVLAEAGAGAEEGAGNGVVTLQSTAVAVGNKLSQAQSQTEQAQTEAQRVVAAFVEANLRTHRYYDRQTETISGALEN
mgnify:CR=1 FL=1